MLICHDTWALTWKLGSCGMPRECWIDMTCGCWCGKTRHTPLSFHSWSTFSLGWTKYLANYVNTWSLSIHDWRFISNACKISPNSIDPWSSSIDDQQFPLVEPNSFLTSSTWLSVIENFSWSFEFFFYLAYSTIGDRRIIFVNSNT